MDFQLKVLLLSFFMTIVIAICIIPILRRLKIGQTERNDGPKSHFSKQGTPTMGGIIIMLAIVSAAVRRIFLLLKTGSERLKLHKVCFQFYL